MPATTKVLSIIDKGVQDRVTKNGECLRRHAECTQRWRNLKERISRTDRDMDNVRRMLLAADMAPSETESNASGTTSQSRSGFLETPPSGSKSAKSKTQNTLSRSMSPFRKLARKMKKGGKSPVPATPTLPKVETRLPASEPARTLKHRSSLFNLLNQQTVPMTPDRPTHKHSQSLTPDSSPARRTESLMSTMKGNRPAWNSSTRVADDEARAATLKGGSQRRASNAGIRTSEDHSSVSSTPYKRSVSRSSMGSSRPWSPVTSSVSTAQSSTNQPLAALYRPPSRSQTPSLAISPRARPTTPSHIPRPSLGGHWRSISSSQSQMSDWDEEGLTSMMQRAFSPTRCQTPSQHPPRPPSRSMIPVPSVQIQGASRPSSAMSNYARPDSAMSFRGGDALRSTPRPSVIQTRGVPPSAFKDSSAPRTPHSRPPSRTGAATPSVDGKGYPVHVYVASNPKDPLDNEVAAIANAISHSLLIERVDPPLRAPPREGEEIRAQYAFSNTLARKVVTCKLTTMARREHITKKVMCRVGGGKRPNSLPLGQFSDDNVSQVGKIYKSTSLTGRRECNFGNIRKDFIISSTPEDYLLWIPIAQLRHISTAVFVFNLSHRMPPVDSCITTLWNYGTDWTLEYTFFSERFPPGIHHVVGILRHVVRSPSPDHLATSTSSSRFLSAAVDERSS